MKNISRTAKKKIIVALLGMCVVASTYNTAQAVLLPGQSSASQASIQNHATPIAPTFAPSAPTYYGYYGYYGYTYSAPYAYTNTYYAYGNYYYGAGSYYYGGSSVSDSYSWTW